MVWYTTVCTHNILTYDVSIRDSFLLIRDSFLWVRDSFLRYGTPFSMYHICRQPITYDVIILDSFLRYGTPFPLYYCNICTHILTYASVEKGTVGLRDSTHSTRQRSVRIVMDRADRSSARQPIGGRGRHLPMVVAGRVTPCVGSVIRFIKPRSQRLWKHTNNSCGTLCDLYLSSLEGKESPWRSRFPCCSPRRLT